MTKPPFEFRAISADWGKHLPDGDYTVGRGADPRSIDESKGSAKPKGRPRASMRKGKTPRQVRKPRQHAAE